MSCENSHQFFPILILNPSPQKLHVKRPEVGILLSCLVSLLMQKVYTNTYPLSQLRNKSISLLLALC